MKVSELIEALRHCNPNDIVEAYDPETKADMPVTGLTYGGTDGIVTLYTDDNEG